MLVVCWLLWTCAQTRYRFFHDNRADGLHLALHAAVCLAVVRPSRNSSKLASEACTLCLTIVHVIRVPRFFNFFASVIALACVHRSASAITNVCILYVTLAPNLDAWCWSRRNPLARKPKKKTKIHQPTYQIYSLCHFIFID